MSGESNGTRKTSSEVWNRLDQQSNAINDIARAQSATEANLSSLAKSVEAGFNDLNAAINRIVDKDNRPTNWIGLGSLVIVVIGSMLTFVALQTDPVRSKTAENDERIDQALQRELRDAEIRGEMKAQIAYLQSEIRLVDEHGSRRWVRDNPK